MWHSIVAAGPFGLLHSIPFPVEVHTGGSEFSGLMAENYGGSSESMMAGAGVRVQGNNKLYLVQDWLNLMSWEQVTYQKLFLLGSTLTFTVDLSGVGCDCNAAVYLVQMDAPGQDSANYCDIQGSDYPRCTEIDLLEGNTHAMHGDDAPHGRGHRRKRHVQPGRLCAQPGQAGQDSERGVDLRALRTGSFASTRISSH